MSKPSAQDTLADLQRETARALDQAARPVWPIGGVMALFGMILGGAISALLLI
ncbi:hypothetical protein [Pontivivens insulae]|uniref:Uncharacterized protein n=1 Tax=Pontivivens insulae TaxID=1639689 RepID=A0A2R8AFV2_9RHOB|nr:hypothetical protein [Pontivivens insulae]RED10685.1 hypothetical protein DFR53_3504 [Pontivivens insulae]SPF31101.1 hypothetical protein POI8812_03452 [Pontivivens insulae]